MYLSQINIKHVVALLFIGSAILLFSCKSEETDQSEGSTQDMMTLNSENLTIINSKEGNKSYKFTTPLLERYELAKEPYTEFRKGIYIEKYNDTTHNVESMLTANYAILLERLELWEAKGNVIGRNSEGNRIETEQLFWDQKSGRIYSNVDSKVTTPTGDTIIGEGFESNDTFTDFTFRKVKGNVTVDIEPKSDTLKPREREKVAQDSTKTETQGKDVLPTIREGEAVARPKK